MADTEQTAKELAEMVARAMEQPGVADVMAIYEAARQAGQAAHDGMQSLQPQWICQSTDTSS